MLSGSVGFSPRRLSCRVASALFTLVLWMPAVALAFQSRAMETSMDGPTDLAMDSEGHLFVVVDFKTVRKIDLSRQTISTVAGNGKDCCYTDGGKANKVSLDFVRALALDTKGDLFIADSDFVREVDAATGIISTIAGNENRADTGDGSLALQTSFRGIDGLAVSPEGDLFIADGQRIFKLDGKTGRVLRVAGSGNQGFGGDGGPALDASLNMCDPLLLTRPGTW